MSQLKINQEHLQYMEMRISSFLVEHPDMQEKYEKGLFPRRESVKDLQVRFNFDLLHYAIGPSWVSENLYSYVNDAHIASALRKICPKVIKKY